MVSISSRKTWNENSKLRNEETKNWRNEETERQINAEMTNLRMKKGRIDEWIKKGKKRRDGEVKERRNEETKKRTNLDFLGISNTINNSVINRLLMVNGSWLMAQGSWLMPQGSCLKKICFALSAIYYTKLCIQHCPRIAVSHSSTILSNSLLSLHSRGSVHIWLPMLHS